MYLGEHFKIIAQKYQEHIEARLVEETMGGSILLKLQTFTPRVLKLSVSNQLTFARGNFFLAVHNITRKR